MTRRRTALVISLLATTAALAPAAHADAAPMTGREFLALCDRMDPSCRSEYVAGLQAVTEGKLACPPQIDENTPITPWLDYMRRRIADKPSVGDREKDFLQLDAFMHLWPCAKN